MFFSLSNEPVKAKASIYKHLQQFHSNSILVPVNVGRHNFKECAEDIQPVWSSFSPLCPKATQALRLWKSMPRSFLEEWDNGSPLLCSRITYLKMFSHVLPIPVFPGFWCVTATQTSWRFSMAQFHLQTWPEWRYSLSLLQSIAQRHGLWQILSHISPPVSSFPYVFLSLSIYIYILYL